MPILDDDAFDRTRRTVLRDEMRYADQPKEGKRPTRFSNCRARNEVWQIFIVGSPTGGTFNADVNVFGTTDTLTFDYDFTAAEVKTELATHTNITSADIDVTGGPFPNGTVNVEFIEDLAHFDIPAPSFNGGSLTGGTGVGIILGRYQPGYPKDGSVAQ